MLAVNDVQAAKLRITARTDAAQDAARIFVSGVHRARHDVKDSVWRRATGAIGREGLPIKIVVMAPAIDEAFHEDVALHRVRPQIQNAAAAQSHHPMRSL